MLAENLDTPPIDTYNFTMIEKLSPANDNDINDPLVMYIIVNTDLGMSNGKIAAQCGHAVSILYEQFIILDKVKSISKDDNQLLEDFKDWTNTQYTKIVLAANQKEFDKLKDNENNLVIVRDAGRTQLSPNTETVIGFFPLKKSKCPKKYKEITTTKMKKLSQKEQNNSLIRQILNQFTTDRLAKQINDIIEFEINYNVECIDNQAENKKEQKFYKERIKKLKILQKSFSKDFKDLIKLEE